MSFTCVLNLGLKSMRAAVFDAAGRLSAIAHRPIATRLGEGMVEQDPEDWWRAALETLDEVAAEIDMGRVELVTVTGSAGCLVPLDVDGRPIRPAIMISDVRAQAHAARIASHEAYGRLTRASARVTPDLMVPKISWFREQEPEAYAKTRWLASPNDFLVHRLTGEMLTDAATASKFWFDPDGDGGYPAPLSDTDPYGAHPSGAWLNRVHGYEVDDAKASRTIHFPRSCLHCATPDCVTVCPTGASYKRAEDGIVLVDEALCIGCGLCAWACPYGARELDVIGGVMKKCTLCVDRIYNENLPVEEREPACVAACPVHARHFGDLGDPASPVSRLVAERDGYDLMPEFGYQPTNKYLPPRPRRDQQTSGAAPALETANPESGFLGWLDAALSRL